MSDAEFDAAVREAVATIPAKFRRLLEGVAIEVEPLPTRSLCAELEVDDPAELLGAYLGTPLTERSVEDGPAAPDRVVLFKRNLQSMCESRTELIEEIRITVLHEIGHHFGLDEDELEEFGYG
ncbi:MAG: metallopeptidase family protein [Phycisphaerae bacterium]